MNFFVIKEVWFRYIFSNQKKGTVSKYEPPAQNRRILPVFFLFYYVSGRFNSRIQLLESG
ncbi:hypothetical protein LEP1GSC016_2895 [Leptospira borgpetersenii serovar Hardjo-bovis str. Sponselee]|uniref:Uncharacterized protein n=1 Tax=Leptospira borgpetersenii serovar Hardjo-bovis str. Sponselee TaxID=1303729 RepID=M6BT85_LEPBO|nr:hypothetical protein LEP1GSC016_2895 [Leptospira borgpetersenii serovar Hardjo-bovis str. Sponselee]